MTAIVYLSPENLEAIQEGKAIKILVTENIRKSDVILIRKDVSTVTEEGE